MNQRATTQNAELAVNQHTKDLIVRGVSENTLKAYRRAFESPRGVVARCGERNSG